MLDFIGGIGVAMCLVGSIALLVGIVLEITDLRGDYSGLIIPWGIILLIIGGGLVITWLVL